jgi:dUTP pyrophosphatase
MILNREELAKLINEVNLVSKWVDLHTQLTPNGFDLTAARLYAFDADGALDFSNKERVLPACTELLPVKQKSDDAFGWWKLDAGAYKVVTNEVVDLPKDIIAMAYPRSSLLRMGAFTQTAVWDAGFRGASEFILVVNNPAGIRIKQNARVVQLVFERINETRQGYSGIYKESA